MVCSGQIGIDPVTNQLAEGIEARTEQALRNQEAVRDAAGSLWAGGRSDSLPESLDFDRGDRDA